VDARDKHDIINGFIDDFAMGAVNDWGVRPINRVRERFNIGKSDIELRTRKWERKKVAAVAKWSAANAVAVKHETALAAGARLRLMRALRVDAIAEAVPNAGDPAAFNPSLIGPARAAMICGP
jgi:hypothetical protein